MIYLAPSYMDHLQLLEQVLFTPSMYFHIYKNRYCTCAERPPLSENCIVTSQKGNPRIWANSDPHWTVCAVLDKLCYQYSVNNPVNV